MKNQFVDILINDDEESYRLGVETASALGREALNSLMEAYGHHSDSLRQKVVRIIGSIEDPSVVPFLKKALEDPSFDVRQSAALSLKILTGEDYYHHIYKTDLGKSFNRSFWCQMDFVPQDQQKAHLDENQKIRENFVVFFKNLREYWTYPEPARGDYFRADRSKSLLLAQDGRVLFKNFNYYLETILVPARDLLYLLGSLARVIPATTQDPSEKDDILRCLRMSLSTQLRKLEKGFDGFLATFHHLRTEFSLVLPRRESIYLAPISQELTDDDRAFMEIFCAGLIRFPQLRHIDSLDTERVAHHMVMLRKCIIEFLNQCEGFGSMGQLDGRNYRILRAIALAVHQGAVHNLILLSYWCKDE